MNGATTNSPGHPRRLVANLGPLSRVSGPEVDVKMAISGIPAAFPRAASTSPYCFLA